MSELNPMDDIDNIIEYISYNLEFQNKRQLNKFITELNERIKDTFINNFDKDYETESSTSDSDTSFGEPEIIEVVDDGNGFLKIKDEFDEPGIKSSYYTKSPLLYTYEEMMKNKGNI